MEKQNKFLILVTFRNVERYIFNCLQSIKEQTYKNYDVILCDDMSTDKTIDIVHKFMKGLPKEINKKFTNCINKERRWKIGNLRSAVDFYRFVIESGNEDSKNHICVILDGDDWFANPNVLQTVNDVYNKTNCLMTYGSYMEFPSMIRGKFSKQVPDRVIKERSYKKYEWSTSHLVTFSLDLWNNIPEDYFVDWNGDVLKFAPDVATILPMLEMAGDRVQFIDEVLYIYNADNPLNEHKVNAELQQRSEHWIRSKPVLDILKHD